MVRAANAETVTQRKRVVIVGGGFGGLTAVRALKAVDVDVVLIDRRNFHLFQPLLYQVATGTLSPANIAAPLSWILRRQRNVRTVLGEVRGFDLANNRVLLADDDLSYDYLIVAAGSGTDYFRHDDWRSSTTGLKTLEDATSLRGRILTALEAPRGGPSATTIAVIGGGPTGSSWRVPSPS